MPVNPGDLYRAGIAGYEAAQREEEREVELAGKKLRLLRDQRDLAERSRAPQTVTLSAPAVPPGLATMPQPGEDPESRAFLPRTTGVPARTETLVEFPRYENPMEFAQRRRQEQAKLDAKQADSEALDRFHADDLKGFYDARARAYGHMMDAVDPQHRAEMMRLRNDDLNAGVELQRRGVTRTTAAPKLFEDFQALEKNPLDRQPFWHAMALIVNSDDPTILKLGMDFLQRDHQAYRTRRIETEQGKAISAVEELILRKMVERGDARIFLDEAEYRKISLEVMGKLPNEVAIYNEVIANGKGAAPGMFMHLFFPGLGGPKEVQWMQEAMQEARAELGRDADPAAVRALADQKFSLRKTGQTPAAQDMKLRLQEQTLKFQEARTRKESMLVEYYRAKTSGRAAVITPKMLKDLVDTQADLVKQLDALPQSQWDESERTERKKILDQDIKDLNPIIKEYEDAVKGQQYGTRQPGGGPVPSIFQAGGGATPSPRPPTDLEISTYDQAKAAWQRDTKQNKGRWEDWAVVQRYVQQVQGQGPPP